VDKINAIANKNKIREGLKKNIFYELTYGDFLTKKEEFSIFLNKFINLSRITKGKNIILSNGSNNFINPFDVFNFGSFIGLDIFQSKFFFIKTK
jgi:RNase P/RNase MRP subunit p30